MILTATVSVGYVPLSELYIPDCRAGGWQTMPETRSAMDLCGEDGPSEVLVVRGAARDSDNKTIHLKQCRHIRKRGRERYRSVAPEALTGDWTVCRWCSDMVDADSGSYGNQVCPRCGAVVTKLPDHLRHHCDGGDSDA